MVEFHNALCIKAVGFDELSYLWQQLILVSTREMYFSMNVRSLFCMHSLVACTLQRLHTRISCNIFLKTEPKSI